ncbi:MAG: fahA [Rickettsiaceae bacterium]|jgi:fumarylacetoacetate (FAA) hydrolase|nr:fahA [Rickettsiaceae bacterium]
MKLASLKNNRDGTLIVVSNNLKYAVKVPHIASTMQAALDNWKIISPRLEEIYSYINNFIPTSDKKISGTISDQVIAHGSDDGRVTDKSEIFALDLTKLASPLPRSYQWLDGSAYVNHVELVRKSRGAEMPKEFWTDPLMYQGASDSFAAPTDPILAASTDWGIDFESEVAVITDDVPMGISAKDAASHIKLIMLVNDVSLRNLIPAELAKGFGFLHGKPATAFSPIAVTPDELGNTWKDGKVHLPLITTLNGKVFGQPNAGVDMTFSFLKLIEHAAKTRFLGAGTIIGSGTVSNIDKTSGSSCIIEKRMLEVVDKGTSTTPFMQFGDTVKIEMLDSNGNSIFGVIEQKVKQYEAI